MLQKYLLSEKSRLLRNISQIILFTFSMTKKEKFKCGVFNYLQRNFNTALEECYDIDWTRKEKYSCKN